MPALEIGGAIAGVIATAAGAWLWKRKKGSGK